MAARFRLPGRALSTAIDGICPTNRTTPVTVNRDLRDPGMHSIPFDSIAAAKAPTQCSSFTSLESVYRNTPWSTENHVEWSDERACRNNVPLLKQPGYISSARSRRALDT